MIKEIIGDIHGKLYGLHYPSNYPKIQVGDFGFGWFSNSTLDLINERNEEFNISFIRGNHDDPEQARKAAGYIGDWKIDGNTLYVSGAWSIDYYCRTEGKSWWYDEELSQEQFNEIEKAILQYEVDGGKIDVVISHDGPFSVVEKMFEDVLLHKPVTITRTGFRLEKLRRLILPKWWFFGHWHVTKQFEYEGTKFQCLGELDSVLFDFKNLEIVK